MHELLQTPLAGPTALGPRVQARWGRDALTIANIACALEQLSCVPVLRTLRRQLETGHVPYQEAWRRTEWLEHRSRPAPQLAGWHGPSTARGMQGADPTALAALVTPERPLAPVPGALGWLTFLMTLLYWHVPLSVWGRWCGVHTTTIVRWVVGLALALWPTLSHWLRARVKAQMGYVDEQWRTIRGRWHSWCVVLDGATALPVLAALLPSRSPWACRWLGRQLRLRKHVPRGLITDGLQA